MKEIWKPFPDERFHGVYEVSSHGKIRSVDRVVTDSRGITQFRPSVTRKTSVNPAGYLHLVVTTRNPRRAITVNVHRIVAMAFLTKPGNDDVVVNHIDGNKLNNHVANLEWVTQASNVRHSFTSGLKVPKKGSDVHFAKINEQDVRKIISLLTSGFQQKEIAKMYNVNAGTICAINAGKSWKHIAIDGISPPYSPNTRRS